MKKSKSLFVAIIIVSIALIASAAINLYSLNNGINDMYDFTSTYALIATSLFGVYYMVSGCKKDESAIFYKIYMALFSLSELTIVLSKLSLFEKILSVLAAILLLILAIGKDLGKRNSLIFATLVLITMIIKWFGLYNDNLLNIKPLTMILLCIATMIIVLAKYQDKASRNSK